MLPLNDQEEEIIDLVCKGKRNVLLPYHLLAQACGGHGVQPFGGLTIFFGSPNARRMISRAM
jgi:hypothetical protein